MSTIGKFTNTASNKVNQLIGQGAKVVFAVPEAVILETTTGRMCKVNAFGKVEWLNNKES